MVKQGGGVGNGADGMWAGHTSIEARVVIRGERVIIRGGDHRGWASTITASSGGMVEGMWGHVVMWAWPLGLGVITVRTQRFLFGVYATPPVM